MSKLLRKINRGNRWHRKVPRGLRQPAAQSGFCHAVAMRGIRAAGAISWALQRLDDTIRMEAFNKENTK